MQLTNDCQNKNSNKINADEFICQNPFANTPFIIFVDTYLVLTTYQIDKIKLKVPKSSQVCIVINFHVKKYPSQL